MMVTTGTDRRWQMTMVNDSQALTGGDITRYTAFVARTSYLSQDRPRIQVRINAGMLRDGKAISARSGACQEDQKIPSWEAESKVPVPLAAEW